MTPDQIAAHAKALALRLGGKPATVTASAASAGACVTVRRDGTAHTEQRFFAPDYAGAFEAANKHAEKHWIPQPTGMEWMG